MDQVMVSSGLAALLRPLLVVPLYGVFLALVLWFCRRFFPRSVDYLFGPITNWGYLAGKVAGRAVRAAIRVWEARAQHSRVVPLRCYSGRPSGSGKG